MMRCNILSFFLILVQHAIATLFSHEVVNLVPPRSLSSITHDDVLDQQGCKALTILFAADSNSLGNVGTHTGPSFFQALASRIGGRQQISIQGIDYPVDQNEYSEDWEYWGIRDTEGPHMIASLAAKVKEQCPLTHLVLSGYGQGAQVVHDAATVMQRGLLDFVRAVVIFGEASHTKRLGYGSSGTNKKIKTYCRGTDPYCLGKEAIGETRLTYTKDAVQAARFVLNRIIGRR